eukprot:360214-Rhodomonas_salina.1
MLHLEPGSAVWGAVTRQTLETAVGRNNGRHCVRGVLSWSAGRGRATWTLLLLNAAAQSYTELQTGASD